MLSVAGFLHRRTLSRKQAVQLAKERLALVPTNRMHILGGGALGTLWAAHCPAATLLLREGTTALQASRLRLRVHRLRAGEAAGPVDEALEACVRLEPSSGSATTPIGTLVIATKAYGAAAALEGVRLRLQPDATVP